MSDQKRIATDCLEFIVREVWCVLVGDALDQCGLNVLVKKDRSSVRIVLYPREQQVTLGVVAAVLHLFERLDRHLDLARVAHVDQPFPELRHGIDRVIEILRRDEHVGIKQVHHASGTLLDGKSSAAQQRVHAAGFDTQQLARAGWR